MQDYQKARDRLHAEIADCELIAKLTIDPAKRTTFERLAQQYRAMLHELLKENYKG